MNIRPDFMTCPVKLENGFGRHLLPVFFLINLLIYSFPLNAVELEFNSLLHPGEKLNYRHWNIKKKQVTGFTQVSFKTVLLENKPFILETNLNRHENGELYLVKNSWFAFKTGKLHRYMEKDLRSGIEIVNSFKNQEITTQITENQQSKEITITVERDLIPFEVLTLSLRKEMPRLMKEKRYQFNLYLPFIASELSKNGLPPSLSKLSMVAAVEVFRKEDTIFGQIEVVHIIVKPGFFLISTLLPKEKSQFRFVFSAQQPYYLLSFEEGETKSVLYEAQNLKN